jgi:hypothetical protein
VNLKRFFDEIENHFKEESSLLKFIHELEQKVEEKSFELFALRNEMNRDGGHDVQKNE